MPQNTVNAVGVGRVTMVVRKAGIRGSEAGTGLG